MSSLIKHDDFSDPRPVQRVDWLGKAQPRSEGSVRSMVAPVHRDPQIAMLETEVVELRRSLAETEREHSAAIAAAHSRGRQEAQQAYIREEAETLSVLGHGIERALANLGETFGDAEKLASLLCQAALEKVFGQSGDLDDLVERALLRQMTSLRAETVLGVQVSASDFPDEASLRKLGQALSQSHIKVARNPQLSAGDCRIDLRLGHIELSLSDHWTKLQRLLTALVLKSEGA